MSDNEAPVGDAWTPLEDEESGLGVETEPVLEQQDLAPEQETGEADAAELLTASQPVDLSVEDQEGLLSQGTAEPGLESAVGEAPAAMVESAEAEPAPGTEQADAVHGPKDGTDDMISEDYTYRPPKRGEIRHGTIIAIGKDGVVIDLGLKREGIIPQNDVQRVGSEVREALAVGSTVPVFVLRPQDREGNTIVSLHRALQEHDWLDAQKLQETSEIWEGEVKGYNRGGLIVPYGKIRGFIPASHLTGVSRRMDSGKLQARLAEMVGETLPLKVIEVDRQRRRLIFSERIARREWRARQRERLLNELREGDHVHGTVRNVCDFGVFVDVGGTDGLIHISELSWRRTRHPSEVMSVGDKVETYVLRVDRDRKRIGLSLRLMSPDPWHTAEERYHIGQLVTGKITNVIDFGAFAGLDDDIEGLIHVSELAEVPPKHPAEIVTLGMALPLRVVKIDTRKRRMGLSLKRVSEEDWAEWEAQREVPAETEELAEGELVVPEALEEEPEEAVAAEGVSADEREEAVATEVASVEEPEEAVAAEGASVDEPEEAVAAEGAPVEEPEEAVAAEGAPVEEPEEAVAAEGAPVEEPEEAVAAEGAPVEEPEEAVAAEGAPVEEPEEAVAAEGAPVEEPEEAVAAEGAPVEEPEEAVAAEGAPVEEPEEAVAAEGAPVEEPEEAVAAEGAPVEEPEEAVAAEGAPVEEPEEAVAAEGAPVEEPEEAVAAEGAPVEEPEEAVAAEGAPVEEPEEAVAVEEVPAEGPEEVVAAEEAQVPPLSIDAAPFEPAMEEPCAPPTTMEDMPIEPPDDVLPDAPPPEDEDSLQ